ncbi:hypothetical protein AMC99_00235 [Altererythrobacter epoxidivorans]|uniref:CENP-V/GFA domain-containing protein n=1 Tax=Altererythrobacter epoxidivorans TaxID=361183 RepID=A0A0M4M5R9_9SPHN|nr:GFA family protein [Altererythrobacter epoxidivorans]ALE15551.1 hypothetical protein AMC99_00235 [Altererythrobacter epoxidivorans]
MNGHEGSCHCGAIRIELRDEPREATECNCSICRRTAGLWHYCSPDAVSVAGEATGYVQGDRMLTTWHCDRCGCTTHWTAIDPAYERMGVNLRMFEPSLWENLPRKQVDGASF